MDAMVPVSNGWNGFALTLPFDDSCCQKNPTQPVSFPYLAPVPFWDVPLASTCVPAVPAIQATHPHFSFFPPVPVRWVRRCWCSWSEQVPIQVNKHLAFSDGMRIVEPPKVVQQGPLSDGLLFTEMDKWVACDFFFIALPELSEINLAIQRLSVGVIIIWLSRACRPDGQPCLETTEFNLVRNMLIAAVEERYKDAGMIPNSSERIERYA